MDLQGKTVLITGASKGIGAATATALVRAGARIAAHYGNDRAGAEQLLPDAASGQVDLLQADLSKPEEVDRLWAEAVARLGHVDVLVNNAGIMHQTGGIPDPIEEWDRVWAQSHAVNVMAPARLMRHAVNDWVARDRPGCVIGIGSWVTTRGTTNPSAIAYAASKAAIAAATKTVARAYAAKGILAYVIAPGAVNTRMTRESAEKTGGMAAVEASLPLGECVPPEEIADLVVYLARGKVRHLTGSTIDVNGAAYIR